jgi:uncharacterized cupin superfamily protein
VPRPVVFAAPADVKLDPAPIPASWIIDGDPQASAVQLAASADGASTIMAWSCTAGCFKWHYTVDETIHIISGEVYVTDEKDNVRRIGRGDMAFFPAGSVSTWYVPDHVRKLAVCRQSIPYLAAFALRAFNKLIGIVGIADWGRAVERITPAEVTKR